MRALCRLGLGLAAVALLLPPLAFEGLYQVGLWGVALPVLPSADSQRLARAALWLDAGERPGADVQPLWLATYSPTTARSDGARAASTVAWLWLAAHPPGHRQNLRRQLSEAAVQVWLRRHASVAELQQALLEWQHFGRRARGLRQAASVYFGLGPESLTPAQLALLVVTLHWPAATDVASHPYEAAQARTEFLTRMASTALLSQEDAARAAEEPLDVLPAPR